MRALAVALPIALLAAPYVAIVAQQTGHFAALNKTSGTWTTGQNIMAGMPYEQASLLLGPELSDYSFSGPSVGPRSVGEAVAFAAFAAQRHARLIIWSLHQPAFGSFAMAALIVLGLLAPPWRRRWPYEALFVGFTAVVFVTLLATMLFEERYLTELVPFTVPAIAPPSSISGVPINSRRHGVRARRSAPTARAPRASDNGFRRRQWFMLSNKRVAVILPAYNAAKTLQRTYDELPHDIVDDVILTDDASRDNTAELAEKLGLHTIRHDANRGYGANQKTCYTAALARGADIVVMLHPDYQYTPKLVTAMASMIASEQFDAVLGSRILGRGALAGGMPVYKYVFNRFLTLVQNFLMSYKLSEYHTGYRAWSRELLHALPLMNCSDDFVFDNQMLAQAIYFGFRIGEISCPTKYFPEASSINFRRSVTYGLGVLKTSVEFRLQRWSIAEYAIFSREDGRLRTAAAIHA